MKKAMESNKRIAFFLAVLLTAAAFCGCGVAAKTTRSASGSDAAYFREPAEVYEADFSVVPGAVMKSASADAGFGNGTLNTESTVPNTEGSAYARKVIYTATLTIRADEPRKVLEAASARCTELGGYLSASYERSYSDGTVQVTATLKVPSDGLDTVLSALGELGKVESSRLSTDDISQSYYDISARLNAAKAEEKQLLALYEKCGTVEEMLLVREQLACVRSDIESYQATVNLWDHQVAYATVELTIRETERTAATAEDEKVELWKASDVFKKMRIGFTNSWRVLLNTIGAIGIFIANAFVPVAVLGTVIYGIVRLLAALCRKCKARRAARRAQRNLKKEEKKKE